MAKPRDQAGRIGSAQRGRKNAEDEMIERLDFLKHFKPWAKEIFAAIEARNDKLIGKLIKQADHMKDGLKAYGFYDDGDVKSFFEHINSVSPKYHPPPRPEGDVATLTLTINRPEELDEAPIQIDQDSG